MNDRDLVGFPISIKTTGTINNPWYVLTPRMAAISIEGQNPPEEPIEITSPCQVVLPRDGLGVFFSHDQMGFVFSGGHPRSAYLVNPIRDFVAYKTFLNFNMIGLFLPPADDDKYPVADTVRFSLQRLVRVETRRREGDKTVTGIHHESRDDHIDLTVAELSQFVSMRNRTLYYAILFYLIGCENLRYFLIEYYKAVESIELAFGGESKLLDQLRPFGVRASDYKRLKRYGNDQKKTPLDIARHAPEPDAPVYAVDLRNLLVDPQSSEVFESSTIACRQVIDSYMAFLAEAAEFKS